MARKPKPTSITTEKMMEAFKGAVEAGQSFSSIKDWAKKAGVSVASAKNAYQDDGFMTAIRAESTRYIAFRLPEVLKRCIDAATGDSWNDRRAILEMMSIYEPNKPKDKGVVPTVLITGDDIMRAWDEYRVSRGSQVTVKQIEAHEAEEIEGEECEGDPV